MAYRDLQELIRILEKEGQLVRISEPVSRDLEITEITDRVSKAHGPALLFECVEGSEFPVLTNCFGSEERMSKALLSENLDEIGDRIGEYLKLQNLMSVKGILRYLPRIFSLLHCIPIRKPFSVQRPACQQVIQREVDLNKIPVLKCWPKDGGRFITLPLVFTKPVKGMTQNLGMYRMQVLDENTTGMHWHKHKDGAGIYEEYRRLGRKMPVSVAIGADPAVTYASTAPLPKGISEIFLAGFLRKKSVRMVKCITNEIYVPEESQFVLEGYVDTEESLFEEGPFGDHTGYYSLVDWYPKFHVTCITHRRDAIYPATVVGKPPMEDCYMAKATERIFLPVLKLAMPALVNLHLPFSGVFHNCAVVSVKQIYPGAAQTVMHQIWGMGQMRYTKLIIVVDETVDICDREAVLAAVLSNVDFSRDLTFSRGPLDALDHSSDEALIGTRVGIDATRDRDAGGGETADRMYVNRELQADGGERKVSGQLLVRRLPAPKTKAFEGKRLGEQLLQETDARIILVVDHEEDETDMDTILWRVFNNIDGERDLVIQKGRMAVDATKKLPEEGLKRPWPEDIVMSRDVVQKVDKKWNTLKKYMEK